MSLTASSPYESFASMSAMPATGNVDTFYLNRETVTGDNDPPTHGDIYLWNGTGYQFYFALQDLNFGGTRPNHPPHYNA